MQLQKLFESCQSVCKEQGLLVFNQAICIIHATQDHILGEGGRCSKPLWLPAKFQINWMWLQGLPTVGHVCGLLHRLSELSESTEIFPGPCFQHLDLLEPRGKNPTLFVSFFLVRPLNLQSVFSHSVAVVWSLIL